VAVCFFLTCLILSVDSFKSGNCTREITSLYECMCWTHNLSTIKINRALKLKSKRKPEERVVLVLLLFSKKLEKNFMNVHGVRGLISRDLLQLDEKCSDPRRNLTS
jgi:predicted RNA polymerase sigma factor